LYKMKQAVLKERLAYAADLVQLTDELGKKVAAYSGGMKRRLSLAIALVHDPQILILDEPTVGIDPELRLSIWNELMLLKRQQGKTSIAAAHGMEEAEKCERTGRAGEGGIPATGTPRELNAAYGAVDLAGVFPQAGRGAQ